MNSHFAAMMLDCCLECDFDMAAVVLEDDTKQYTLTTAATNHSLMATTTGESSRSIQPTLSNSNLSSEQCDDCPLCLEPMHSSDWLIPMLCPLAPQCPFNYCTQCVWNLLLASSQPYQEASDGSHQLKVPLQCPQCRTKYPHRQTVQDVLLLRQAWRVQPMFFTPHNAGYRVNESSLRASELATKHAFAEQVTYAALADAWSRTHRYLTQRQAQPRQPGASDTAALLSALPEQWKEHLRHETRRSPSQSTTANSIHSKAANDDDQPNHTNYQMYSLVDPTLFCGLEESMTLSEQQFLSELLTSGRTSNLVRAAHILNGMLSLLQMGRSSSLAKSNAQQPPQHVGAPFAVNTTQPTPGYRVLTTTTDILYPDMDTAVLRKRFQLPVHMPRWISLPVYDPQQRSAPLVLQEHVYGLEIVAVKGTAGKQGLRRGDIVTHVDDEVLTKPIHSSNNNNNNNSNSNNSKSSKEETTKTTTTTTVEQYHHYLRQRYELEGGAAATMTLVVNAHEQVAKALQERAQHMIDFLTMTKQQQQQQQQQQQLSSTSSAHGKGGGTTHGGGGVSSKPSW